MQITTATRTVEIYANNEAGITYRNVKDGKATGPVRSADRATAKAGSVGREIMDAIDAQAAEEAAEAEVTETVAPVAAQVEVAAAETVTEGAEIEVTGRKGLVTAVYPAVPGERARGWAGVLWETTEAGAQRPSHGFVYLDQVTRV